MMLALFIDLGVQGPYVGLLKLALLRTRQLYRSSIYCMRRQHLRCRKPRICWRRVPEFPANLQYCGGVDPVELEDHAPA